MKGLTIEPRSVPLTDADFNGLLFRALFRRQPNLDPVRAQAVGLRIAADPDILAWAASENRLPPTHDRDTMPGFAYDRVRTGLPLPGVFGIRNRPEQIGKMVEDILLIASDSSQEEWKDRVVFLPL